MKLNVDEESKEELEKGGGKWGDGVKGERIYNGRLLLKQTASQFSALLFFAAPLSMTVLLRSLGPRDLYTLHISPHSARMKACGVFLSPRIRQMHRLKSPGGAAIHGIDALMTVIDDR